MLVQPVQPCQPVVATRRHRPGERETPDPARVRACQCRGTCPKRRSSGADVVEYDIPSSIGQRDTGGKRERLPDVVLPMIQIVADLWRCGASAHQCRQEGYAGNPTQFFREQLSLVVPSLSSAPWMQRNRYEGIDTVPTMKWSKQPIRQRGRTRRLTPILEPLNGSRNPPFIGKRRSDLIKMLVQQRTLTSTEPIWNTTAATEWRWQRGHTRQAERTNPGTAPVTPRAQRWIDHVDQDCSKPLQHGDSELRTRRVVAFRVN